jgi:hypothetical protein
MTRGNPKESEMEGSRESAVSSDTRARGIRSSGRRMGWTGLPNWRLEDPTLDPYELRVALWLASHADGWLEEHVTRNEIARRTHVSQGKVSQSLAHLQELGVIVVETVEMAQHEGARRLVVTFDFAAWNAEPGHVATGPRSCGDR